MSTTTRPFPLVFPGDDLSGFIEEKMDSIINLESSSTAPSDSPMRIQVGPGIIQNGTEILALKAGFLKTNSRPTQAHKFSLLSPQRRYVPLQNDLVVGIVTARLAEFFRVDVGAASTATLSLLTGFEGASRKTRPTWAVGTAIFARVALAHPDLEPELTCFDPSGNVPADLFGELGGSSSNATPGSPASPTGSSPSSPSVSTIIRTSCHFSKSLQNPQATPVLAALGRHFAFEIAAGANGRVYLECSNDGELAALAQFIRRADDGLGTSDHQEIGNAANELAASFGKKSAK